MRSPIWFGIFPFACLSLSQCAVERRESDGIRAARIPESVSGTARGFTAGTGPGSVTIRDNGRVVTSIRTAMPNVEETRWHEGKSEIAVKSRGSHGPATIQLFDSRTGRQLGAVLAYEAANGPAWAKGMAE